MKQKRRSVGFIFTILCTFTLLLAACGASTSSNRNTMTQHTARLNLRETPAILDTTTPGLTTPGLTTPGLTTPSTTTTTPAEYVGQIPNENAWIGLSTTEKRMVAFVTDGSPNHQPTFAQWFRGSTANGVVDATATAKTGADRLQATLAGNTATGTVTFASGKSLAFTANAVPTSDQTAGLYRSERIINNQDYVAGWVVLPAAGAQATETPSTGFGSPTPSSTEMLTPTITPPPGFGGLTPSSTETLTPTTTPTATQTITGALQQGGAILNEKNYNVLPVPALTQDQINSKQITIPNLSTFKLVPCQQNLC